MLRLLPLLALSLLTSLAAGPVQPREATPLATGWRFHFGAEPGTVQSDGFDDSAWQQVTLPHTWNHLGEYSLTRTSTTDNRQGIGWYRLAYVAAAAAEGNRFYLDFAAVGSIAEVWVNGVRIGEHKGAFSRFRFDVTTAWKPGSSNLIVVKADNSKPAIGSSTQDVIPLGGDFFIHGGLYRGVSLITADSAGIDLLDHGGPGVYAHAAAITADKAEIAVLTRLRNSATQSRPLRAVATIADASGRVVATHSASVVLAPGTAEVRQSLTLAKPHLWNGRSDPYLYSVTVALRDAAGTFDSVTQPLGMRSFHIDVNQGFILNGKHLALHGAARHQDRQGQGWELSDADHDQDMAMMAEIGANTVRMAHYQHADEWMHAADRTGMVAWAEIPFVNAASFLDGGEASPELTTNARQQLIELIRQAFNHPSIVMWSVGNEVDIGAAFGRSKLPARSRGLLQDLNALAHQEDPSRLTVFADCCEAADGIAVAQPGAQMLAGTTDLIGYNRYYGWYYGSPADLGPKLDYFHAKHPETPMSVSEYGAGGALSQHTDNPQGGLISSFGRPHPEEYQSWYHEQSWKQIEGRGYVFASWMWNMFDFASDLREEGDAFDINDKGLVTYDHKTRKDAFYFYQANWSDQLVVHINGRRYVDRAYPVTDVRVYSNAPSVSLTLNGASLGAQPCPERICVWHDVALRPGANHLEATATHGGLRATDSLDWQAPDAAAGLHIDAGNLVGHTAAQARFGSDNFFTGGLPKLLNAAVLRGRPKPIRRDVSGAGDPELFAAWREGDMTYTLPLPAGRWQVVVDSFEPDPAQADSRSFDVLANGKVVAAAFNPSAMAGGALKAVQLRFDAESQGGGVVLQFVRKGGEPVVAAIEVIPAGDTKGEVTLRLKSR